MASRSIPTVLTRHFAFAIATTGPSPAVRATTTVRAVTVTAVVRSHGNQDWARNPATPIGVRPRTKSVVRLEVGRSVEETFAITAIATDMAAGDT